MTQMVTKPMSFHKPVEKICGELHKKDASICDLKYGECNGADDACRTYF